MISLVLPDHLEEFEFTLLPTLQEKCFKVPVIVVTANWFNVVASNLDRLFFLNDFLRHYL